MIGQLALLRLLLLFLLFPTNITSSINFKTACELLRLPRDCHCQRTRGVPITSLNETRLRCRQLSRITTDYQWAIVPYDRLAFETPNDNLTIHRFAFANIRARTVRFNVQNLFINDHAFTNAYIGQLAISHMDTYGTLNFQLNGKVFYGTTITNIYIKLVDFQSPVSEIILSNSRIYTFIIQASKFHGFTNQRLLSNQQNETNLPNEHQPDNFLEYDFMMTTSSSSSYQTSSPPSRSLKIHRQKKAKISRQLTEFSDENSSQLSEKTVTMDVTGNNLPAYITIYTILSSINTTNLTEYYFPNNLDYSQTDQIELSYNSIKSINDYAFRHLQYFEGRLILTYNRIQYLSPYALANLRSLTNLSLANNSIESLTWTHFHHLNQLYELDLSYNQIEKLTNYTFQYLTNLHILRLNNNPLKFIESNTFNNLTQLKQIYLHSVQLMRNLDPFNSYWLWDLANLHVNYLLKTDFDLSDVAFCLLSRTNQTVFHSPRQYSCPCNVHYLYHNPNADENSVYSPTKYHTNYLRLTPSCILNETSSFYEQYPRENEPSSANDFILRGLEDKCDYKLMFLDCDAMTTTTTTTVTTVTTTTTSETPTTTTTETISAVETISSTTTQPPTTTMTTPWYYKYTKPPKTSANNTRKLFTVLGTLIAITVAAIIVVILWYRLKAVFKRQQKKKKIVEQQKHFNSPTNHHQQVTAPRYASSEMLSSIHSGQLMGNKSQSQALITPSSPSAIVYKNIEATIGNEPGQILIDDENQSRQQQQQQEQEQPASLTLTNNAATETQATTEC